MRRRFSIFWKNTARPSYLRRKVVSPVANFFWGLRYVFGLGLLLIVSGVFYIANLAYKQTVPVDPFPVSVIPSEKLIIEDPKVENFAAINLVAKGKDPDHLSWLDRALHQLTQIEWYQHLASPGSKLLVIDPGDRKEQVAADFGDILGWTKEEEDTFLSMVSSATPSLPEGTFFPDDYLVSRDVGPETMALLVNKRFSEEVLSRYPKAVADRVPLEDAIVIASILEREAYDFTDMREISGVIWNRLFIGMNLQIDATLQYARGSEPTGPWWPVPTPRDKYIDSPYNTYQNKGLPPGPISNPSLSAVIAALNPIQTKCIFYFHDRNSRFHCSETYEEHVSLLKQYYGRGK